MRSRRDGCALDRSPIHAVLVEEVRASVPPEIADALGAAADLRELHAWLAAAEIYDWIEPEARPAFVQALSDEGPHAAGLSAARAIASRLAPPERNASWRGCDAAGALLALLAALSVVAARVFLLQRAAGLGLFSTSLGDLVRALAGDPLLRAALLAWSTFEALLAPRLFEALRRLPARLFELPAPVPWRIDMFRTAWVAQACASASACWLTPLAAGSGSLALWLPAAAHAALLALFAAQRREARAILTLP
jgi:hypothetical protein